MELVLYYKLLGFLSLFALFIMLFLKRGTSSRTFFSVLFKILLVGYYFMTFFIEGNKIALIINYVLLLVTITFLIFNLTMKKYITPKMKAATGLIFLVIIVGLIVNSFFI
ncbi:MAG: hypothetical protein WC755_02480 [Candidatus Woesearchaeota archaeon]|jgi:hypothetical protein